MTKTDWLLVALGVLAIARIVQSEIQHRALLRLLNDLCTMLSEALFD